MDKIGQKVRIDESGTNPARTLKYTYDDVYRLMSEYDSLGTGTTTSYVYDDVGNRVSKDVNGTAYTYTVDQLNRVTAVSGGSTIAWTYDANGNTATKTTGGVTHTYSYDRENRLVDVSTTSGSIFSAVYDYRSRRLEKTENSSTVKYLYDGGVSVQEYDGQGSLTKVLVRGSGYGGGIGSVIYTADDANGTNRRFFLYNALGSTSAMTNDAMTVTSTSSYDGWGKEISSTGSSETDRKFCTKERSASIGLDYFRFRYYDYDLGRFSTRDPAGYPDGLNNYLYCNNDPVNKIDPLGLKKKKGTPGRFTVHIEEGKYQIDPKNRVYQEVFDDTLQEYRNEIVKDNKIIDKVKNKYQNFREAFDKLNDKEIQKLEKYAKQSKAPKEYLEKAEEYSKKYSNQEYKTVRNRVFWGLGFVADGYSVYSNGKSLINELSRKNKNYKKIAYDSTKTGMSALQIMGNLGLNFAKRLSGPIAIMSAVDDTRVIVQTGYAAYSTGDAMIKRFDANCNLAEMRRTDNSNRIVDPKYTGNMLDIDGGDVNSDSLRKGMRHNQ